MATATPPAPGPSLFGKALVLALVLGLAWQLAYWTWVFLTPPAVRAAPKAEGGVDLALAARLFGGSIAEGPASAASPSTSSLKLKGVVAPTPGVAASAIFSASGARDAAIFVGSEVQPGVKLAEVHPDHVIVTRGGIRERIDLEARQSAAGPLARPASRPGGFKLNVARPGGNQFAFSRRELDEALRDPHQLGYLGQIGMPPQGGVRMEAAPPGSLAAKLGLQPGDILKKINGQPVASTGDLARLYQQFATLSQIQAEVQRGSQTLSLTYAIQP